MVLLCTLVSLAFGVVAALVYMVKSKHSKSFVVTLALLPAMVQIVIMLVNGNIGAGVAVAGTFSLVRFRSIPGSAREIGSIFFAMALGLITGMGYLFYGFLFLVIICVAMLALNLTTFGGGKQKSRVLKITIPENLDYDKLYDDIFTQYAASVELTRVKTVSMGSLFELTYEINLKSDTATKSFIDEIRCRNGNLAVSLSRELTPENEL
jgi:hypothetical protein